MNKQLITQLQELLDKDNFTVDSITAITNETELLDYVEVTCSMGDADLSGAVSVAKGLKDSIVDKGFNYTPFEQDKLMKALFATMCGVDEVVLNALVELDDKNLLGFKLSFLNELPIYKYYEVELNKYLDKSLGLNAVLLNELKKLTGDLLEGDGMVSKVQETLKQMAVITPPTV